LIPRSRSERNIGKSVITMTATIGCPKMTYGRCKDGWICEEHPDNPWPHDDCAGPGMQCPNPECRGGKVTRHRRDDSTSCSRRPARRRHRRQVWPVLCAKRRSAQSRISRRRRSVSGAKPVDTDGAGTIRGQSDHERGTIHTIHMAPSSASGPHID
jgi:hypothetical protein